MSDSSDSIKEWGGSKEGKLPNIPRDFSGAHNMLVHHSFSGTESLYNDHTFERRFGTSRGEVLRLVNVVMGIVTFVLKQIVVVVILRLGFWFVLLR